MDIVQPSIVIHSSQPEIVINNYCDYFHYDEDLKKEKIKKDKETMDGVFWAFLLIFLSFGFFMIFDVNK